MSITERPPPPEKKNLRHKVLINENLTNSSTPIRFTLKLAVKIIAYNEDLCYQNSKISFLAFDNLSVVG